MPADGSDAEMMPVLVTGLVEGLAGGYLSGWAIDPGQPEPCEILVVDEAGGVVAAGRADRPRSDLSVYAFGRSDFAFRVAVPALGQSGSLRVYADGAELSGSPLLTGAGLFDGVVSVIDGYAEGWVHERRLDFVAPGIALFDQDDFCLGRGESTRQGGDALFSPARFRIRLDPMVFRRPRLALRAEANEVPFAATHALLVIEGFLDQLDGVRCSGWVCCAQAPSVPLELELRRDDVLVGSFIAQLARGDLRQTRPRSWRVGFDFKLPASRASGQPQVFSLRIRGCDRELFDGPLVLGPSGAFIATARRLARLVHAQPELDATERTVLQAALAGFIATQRAADSVSLKQARVEPAGVPARRFSVVVPIYRDVELTCACINSVLAHRDAGRDALVLVNDDSPEPDMAEALDAYAALPHVHVLTNRRNLGFVQSVNRALDFCAGGDVILLNSDTRVFAGGLAELWAAAHSAPEIGTATALSNNATIFSYPMADLPCATLDDIDWTEAAAIALTANAGSVVDVPTGHGFCMLVKRAMLDRVGKLDETFGRGYGEENDLCLRSADLGWRHVAAAGVFVEHRESVSFADEKDALLRTNLPKLERRYPEYAGDVQAYLRRDDLRSARWPLDAFRLRRRTRAGQSYVLVLRNWLQGGTEKAIGDIARFAGYGEAQPLMLSIDADGNTRLRCETPMLSAVFAPGEQASLFSLLEGVEVRAVLVHQLLGHTAGFVAALRDWSVGRRVFYYLHDFYPICPRVTMIDAVGTFCDVAPVEICVRCVDLAGAHDAARMNELGPAAHRALFHDVLAAMDQVIVPSPSAAAYLKRAFPDIHCVVVPHPEPVHLYDVAGPRQYGSDVVLFGAIGPHKGSAKLLEVAQRARMVAPALHFHVVGYTDIDEELREAGNVSVSGAYQPDELARLVAATGAKLALFLHRWPETFSYTLSEAVQMGLVPLVPDIGAPADRVRAAGYGVVFGFPIDAAEVLGTLLGVIEGRIDPAPGGAGPARFGVATHPAYLGGALLPGLGRAAAPG